MSKFINKSICVILSIALIFSGSYMFNSKAYADSTIKQANCDDLFGISESVVESMKNENLKAADPEAYAEKLDKQVKFGDYLCDVYGYFPSKNPDELEDVDSSDKCTHYYHYYKFVPIKLAPDDCDVSTEQDLKIKTYDNGYTLRNLAFIIAESLSAFAAVCVNLTCCLCHKSVSKSNIIQKSSVNEDTTSQEGLAPVNSNTPQAGQTNNIKEKILTHMPKDVDESVKKIASEDPGLFYYFLKWTADNSPYINNNISENVDITSHQRESGIININGQSDVVRQSDSFNNSNNEDQVNAIVQQLYEDEVFSEDNFKKTIANMQKGAVGAKEYLYNEENPTYYDSRSTPTGKRVLETNDGTNLDADILNKCADENAGRKAVAENDKDTKGNTWFDKFASNIGRITAIADFILAIILVVMVIYQMFCGNVDDYQSHSLELRQLNKDGLELKPSLCENTRGLALECQTKSVYDDKVKNNYIMGMDFSFKYEKTFSNDEMPSCIYVRSEDNVSIDKLKKELIVETLGSDLMNLKQQILTYHDDRKYHKYNLNGETIDKSIIYLIDQVRGTYALLDDSQKQKFKNDYFNNFNLPNEQIQSIYYNTKLKLSNSAAIALLLLSIRNNDNNVLLVMNDNDWQDISTYCTNINLINPLHYEISDKIKTIMNDDLLAIINILDMLAKKGTNCSMQDMFIKYFSKLHLVDNIENQFINMQCAITLYNQLGDEEKSSFAEEYEYLKTIFLSFKDDKISYYLSRIISSGLSSEDYKDVSDCISKIDSSEDFTEIFTTCQDIELILD